MELALVLELHRSDRRKRRARIGHHSRIQARSAGSSRFLPDGLEFVLVLRDDVVRKYLEVARDAVFLDERAHEREARLLRLGVSPRRVGVMVALEPGVRQAVTRGHLRGGESRDSGREPRALHDEHAALLLREEESRRQSEDPSAHDGNLDLLRVRERRQCWAVSRVEPERDSISARRRHCALKSRAHCLRLPGASSPPNVISVWRPRARTTQAGMRPGLRRPPGTRETVTSQQTRRR